MTFAPAFHKQHWIAVEPGASHWKHIIIATADPASSAPQTFN